MLKKGAFEDKGHATIQNIPIDRIELPPWGDLRAYRDIAFESRLKEDLVIEGVIDRPIVRPNPSKTGFFECIDGWSRVVQWSELGHSHIECDVIDIGDADSIVASLKMNIMRKSHDPIGMAKAFKLLHDDYGMRYADVADRFGYNKSHVYKLVRLLKLDDETKDKVAKGEITINDALAIVSRGGAGDVLRPVPSKSCDFCHGIHEAHEVNTVVICRSCEYLLRKLLDKREKALREELEREAKRRKQRQQRLTS